jgi:hypothetical protein
VQWQNVTGSTVEFYRGEASQLAPPVDDDRVLTYAHRLGVAALHTGAHWHKANQLDTGLRSSLIVWADIVD